jgi:signal peptidase I
MGRKIFIFVWELFKVTVISLAIILPVRYYLIQPFYVRGASMEPNFHNHEYLIVDQISYRFRQPERGEVIVFRYPRNPQEYFIKRVIALPNESIEIINGDVYIYNELNPDGVLIDEPYLDDNYLSNYNSEEKIILSANEYYVLGDNRGSSMDSRSFGPLNEKFITGKVLLRGLPVNRATIFNHLPTYEGLNY